MLSSRVLLAAIVVLPAIIALRPAAVPLAPVHAQGNSPLLFVEPGTTGLRNPINGFQIEGKVIVDLETGNIWGFPTAANVVYPVNTAKSEPPLSKPFLLGRFDLA